MSSSYPAQVNPHKIHASVPQRHGASHYKSAVSMGSSAAPAGTFIPGTKVQVGSHRVVVEKYLSEGGFAHVYVVRLSQPVDGVERAVLKRVAVPDTAALTNMRIEVDTMKKLKGHRHIVTYIDSHASQLKGGGYEVFLLMEFCAGGGLIDFMNTRLQNRLTEPEILKIFSDAAEGVACLHYLKPPLLHRDLKVENVLISLSNSSYSYYKLCDFGSAAPPRPAATTAAEGRLIEDDIQRHTTLQYRSPEMIDVYRKQPIDEKSDIWALGVLLYKLCYYTTPFEEVGQMAILNATFKFPTYPPFSDRLKALISSMLRENPQKRPTIYDVLREACHMQGKEVPIRDIYAERSQSEVRRYQELPPSPTEAPKVGAVFSPPVQETQIIPDIAPMRRGRPARPSSQHNSTKPSPSPFRALSTDPFVALDGGKLSQTKISDELSFRFPTLDQFSLLHEKGGNFDFEPTVAEAKQDAKTDVKTDVDDLSQRVANALADDAFAKPSSPVMITGQEPVETKRPQSSPAERRQKESPNPAADSTRNQPSLYKPVPEEPKMVSTGTMTSPSPPLPPTEFKAYSNRPIYRFPPPGKEVRPSQHRPVENEGIPAGPGCVPSQTTLIHKLEPKQMASDLPVSSRPSLEALRPSLVDISGHLTRSKSANSKPRPTSAYGGSKSDYMRDKDSAFLGFDQSRNQHEDSVPLQHTRTDGDRDYERANIASDVDFLRAREEEITRKKEKRHSSGSKHVKRSSLSSLSLAGTKGLLSSRFGEAFRRFEHNVNENRSRSRSPSPSEANKLLSPIIGSERTDTSDDGIGDGGQHDISPEMRRELERRRLSQEEKRVASAAAEYRLRVAERGSGGRALGGREGTKAPVILNKVQSLLQENNKPSPKTASGYGRFTDSVSTLQGSSDREQKPLPTRPKPFSSDGREPLAVSIGTVKDSTALDVAAQPQRTGPRPTAPPKPRNLRTGGAADATTSSDHKLIPSLPDTPTSPGEGWEKFSRRYPNLSRLELVETEIDVPRLPSIRTRDV
ncbi:hypothetical protein Egran_05404 [Elaphomyces granulatus]|uniref:non-specific serine/threonine protein kinase n=1 Tax=Elaphomyces granulatus TaxID=519963 RepID=A0A232LRR6_9EURO|nr:hypothetical protein Egran_05404 [Elaphomyces granulatus]